MVLQINKADPFHIKCYKKQSQTKNYIKRKVKKKTCTRK